MGQISKMNKKIFVVVAGVLSMLLLSSCGSKAPEVKVIGNSSASETQATPVPSK
jgi:outer membrane murein-binding lipoprotein Lpp